MAIDLFTDEEAKSIARNSGIYKPLGLFMENCFLEEFKSALNAAVEMKTDQIIAASWNALMSEHKGDK